jgi:surfactin synthase thioesterase subunit
LPAWIECVALDLPGHGRLRAEQPRSEWPSLVDALIERLDPLPARPFAIYGHSMGALVGLELAHRLRDSYGRTPVWLGAAACAAPACRTYEEKWLGCPDDVMIAELRRLGGTPEELLGDREFLDLALPVLRADFHLCATYAGAAGASRAPLDCALLALGGRDDALSEQPENLSAWAHETSGHFARRLLNGGHFFLETERAQLIREIVASLRDAMPAGGRPGRRSEANAGTVSPVPRTMSRVI